MNQEKENILNLEEGKNSKPRRRKYSEPGKGKNSEPIGKYSEPRRRKYSEPGKGKLRFNEFQNIPLENRKLFLSSPGN